MSHDRIVQIWCLVALVIALVGSTFLTTRLSSSVSEHQLAFTDTAEQATTPEEALGIAAGAFRGLFVNWLWMRAQDLKQDGKYHESVELARTITRLQPRFPRVWAFHAWNLAYNISVAAQNATERWQWVNAGISLLRDEGIPRNPDDMLLHKELAWIFLHKVQGIMDDSNQFYKRQFALEWTIALGSPPVRTPELRTTDKYRQAMIDWLEAVRKAPDRLETLLADEAGQTRAMLNEDPAYPGALPELVARLREKAGIDVRQMNDIWRLRKVLEVFRSVNQRSIDAGKALRELGRKLTPEQLEAQDNLRGMLMAQAMGDEYANSELAAIISDPRYTQAFTLLNRHLRKRILVEKYHMEPDRMIRYTEKYGPMDWRLPHAHAVYWSARGVEQAQDKRNQFTVENMDFLNTDRITIQAVQELFRAGTLMFDIVNPDLYLTLPSVDYVDVYGNILAELTERERQQFLAQKGVDTGDRVWTLYRAGYENFLHDVISLFYRRGELARAKQYQLLLATWPGRVQNDIMQQQIREWDLDRFVVWNIQERITSPNIASAEISSALFAAYVQGLLAGDNELFVRSFEYAQKFHLEYFKAQYRKTSAAEEGGPRMAVVNPDFRMFASQVFAALLQTAPPQDATIMYLRAPKDLQTSTWDILDRANPGSDANSPLQILFPRPPDIDEYRAMLRIKSGQDTQRGGAELK
jgi:hypothetical protein